MQFTEIKDILTVLQGFVLPILGYGIYLLTDIRTQLQVLNSRVTRLETWTKGHEALDNERTETIKQAIRDCPSFKANH